eukprot:Gb_37238 [translate_table: standard]
MPGVGGFRAAPNSGRKRWARLLPCAVIVIVVWKIVFLGHLDMAKQSSVLATWKDNFHVTGPSTGTRALSRFGLYFDQLNPSGKSDPLTKVTVTPVDDICEDWLEKEDSVNYARNFTKDPIWVVGEEQDWSTCTVGCVFRHTLSSERKADAAFGLRDDPETANVLRSMESSHYYPENNIDVARGRGYKVIMTTSLSSDVPVGYFSWAEYAIMAPLQPKTENALAAAFISNCGGHNFRLQALDELQKLDVPVDSYGACHRNRDGRVDKVEALKHYKFSLAFENSNEEDYVTEKFFQSLVAGAIPVVVGAPNIEDFAPSPNSILHIKTVEDIKSIAQTMKYLASNPAAYNKTLRWKFEGPSDSFKALVDMAAVHSSCRLCIHLATQIQEKEERAKKIPEHRPCKCKKGSETVYHLYVRERGRFEMQSVFIRSHNLTLKGLELSILLKFKSLNHVPIWKTERPEAIRGGDELKIYRIYPVGLTQRQALYTWKFHGDDGVRSFLENNPCAKLEVIFV